MIQRLQGASGSGGGLQPWRMSYGQNGCRELNFGDFHPDEAAEVTEVLGVALPWTGRCPLPHRACMSS